MVALAVGVVAPLASTLALEALLPGGGIGDPGVLLVGLAVLQSIQLVSILGYCRYRRAWSALRLSFPARRGIRSMVEGLSIGTSSQLAFVGLFVVLQNLFPEFDVSRVVGPVERQFGSLSVGLKVAFIFVAGLAAPVTEELYFRGLLLYAFDSGSSLGRVSASLLSASVFAVLHFNVAALPIFLVLGLLLAWLVYRHRSVYPAIAAHAGFNMTAFFLLLVESALARNPASSA